jgi:hypothetical protein
MAGSKQERYMKIQTMKIRVFAGSMFVAIALVFSLGLANSGCDATTEAIDNFDSRVACGHYCTKNFDCQNTTPTGDQTDTCISGCRNSIEDTCGNDNQAAANDQIETCVDKGCAEFWTCMVFSAAPECYGFVTQ